MGFLWAINTLCLTLPSASFALEWDPHFEAEARDVFYPDEGEASVNRTLFMTNLQAPADLRFSENLDVRVRPELQLDPQNNSIRERYWFELPEGLIRLKPSDTSPVSFQAGFNTFTWGVTDAYNPLDVVSARRYEDPMNSEKLGAPSLKAHVDLLERVLSLDAIYFPHQRKAILPGENSRWLPRKLFQSRLESFNGQDSLIVLPPTVNYTFNDSQMLDHADQNNVGLKLDGHLPSLDFSAVYYNGLAPVPATDIALSGTVTSFTPTLVIQADPGIAVTPVYYRQETYGGSAVYGMDWLILRAEAAFTRVFSKRDDLPGYSNEFSFEGEHSFDVGSGNLTAILEVTYAQHSEPVDPTLTSIARVFDRGVLIGARYSPQQNLQGSLFLLEDTRYHDQFYRIEITDALTDNIKLIGVGDVLRGELGTPLGTYQYNSRGSVGLRFAL